MKGLLIALMGILVTFTSCKKEWEYKKVTIFSNSISLRNIVDDNDTLIEIETDGGYGHIIKVDSVLTSLKEDGWVIMDTTHDLGYAQPPRTIYMKKSHLTWRKNKTAVRLKYRYYYLNKSLNSDE